MCAVILRDARVSALPYMGAAHFSFSSASHNLFYPTRLPYHRQRAKLDQKVRILCRHHPRQGPEEKERYMSVLETSAPPEWFSIPESVLEVRHH